MTILSKLFIAVALGALSLLAFQCQPQRTHIEDSDAMLTFTLDTLYFDTVFTTIGTVTKSFRVKNPNNQFIMIDDISLAGGNNSVFRINVDGAPGTRFSDLEIAPKDSMFIFVEATLDPNETNDILLIEDSIFFSTNGNQQHVNLAAWGQDVHMISGGWIDEDVTWPNDKPYLIIDYLYVDSLSSLTIDPGVIVFMHYNALLYVDGTLELNGTIEEPVLFRGDRLEDFFKDVPGQWRFIYLSEDSHSNVIDNAEIICGTMGVLISASPESGLQPDLQISNTTINYMSSNGIYSLNASISASNLVVGDCGGSCAALIYGGAYDFKQCTFYNAWPTWYSNRQLPALFMADYFANIDEDGNLVIYTGGEYEKAEFTNSIVSGNSRMELVIDSYDDLQMNYRFDYCLTRINTDSVDYTTDPRFTNILNNEDPLLDSVPVLYSLDTLSPAIDAGFAAHAIGVPFDYNGVNRLADEAPDMGAFERVED